MSHSLLLAALDWTIGLIVNTVALVSNQDTVYYT